MEPDNLFAMNSLYQCKIQIGETAAAHDIIKKAVAIGNQDVETCFNYGVSCMDIGKYEESIKYFEKALGLVRDLDLKERIVFNLALAY